MNTIRFNPSYILIAFLMMVLLPLTAWSKPSLKGQYEALDEPSLHQPGKVLLLEFADFYCPHCHMFEQVAIPKLKNVFGEHLETRMVGFPVIPGKLPTAFEMYEQARVMGKGQEMKRVLFRSIHKDHIQIFDKSIRALIIKEVGLSVEAFERGLSTGKPFRALEQDKAWGLRIGVTHTPTVVLDGNLRIDNLTIENLKVVIQSILDQDQPS